MNTTCRRCNAVLSESESRAVNLDGYCTSCYLRRIGFDQRPPTAWTAGRQERSVQEMWDSEEHQPRWAWWHWVRGSDGKRRKSW